LPAVRQSKFGIVEGFVVGAAQAGVEQVLDGEFELGASTGFLPPVEDERTLNQLRLSGSGISVR
jgi:hypothetical protein